jgi:hypothetical protein
MLFSPLEKYGGAGQEAATIMLSAEECLAHSEHCATIGKNSKTSMQRATILMAMARSWNTLAGQIERYQAALKAENDQAA